MSTIEKLSELESRRAAIEKSSNGDAKKSALAKGKLTARDRITNLLDENSFVEMGTFVKSRSLAFNMDSQDTPCDGVVSGYGTVNGSPVYVYSQDASVLGGALGEMHAKKIVNVYDKAMKMGVPVVGFLDTVGLRLQETVDALEGYGAIFTKMTQASGVIPQLAVIAGDCAGGAAFIAGLSDFVFMSSKNARVFLNSPNAMEDKKASFDTLATAKVHAEESGLASFISDKEEDLIKQVKELLSYLPLNSEEEIPFYTVTDDINRVEAGLNNFDFENGKVVDIVTAIVDNGSFLELQKDYSQSVLTAFARFNGGTTGIIATTEAQVDYKGVKKVTSFVNLCDAYGIPVVTLTNIEGFTSTVATENMGMVKETSRLVHAFANASIPKVNVLLNHAFGSSYVAMNSKHIGADYVLAWPTAQVSTLNPESAVRIMYEKEIKESTVAAEKIAEKVAEYEALTSSSYAVAAKGYIDDIIEPAATRKRVIAALEILATKQVDSYKKHPTV
ncbi:carboxyl transferase [Sporanaerobium hydrogeniformans]|uniref:Carboxyl transferase n=1 Tax=Sporanaerobium hydrogeniformans TaxID=3072179 RepID=A0AC61DD04_9FIRM|nr:carboxyl transferase domain-containing protein [Sporanaerobium hydrogeniformans]PHV71159.1 carboxyl transferase [Sporanaerobium hydrogeniformans]